MLEKRHSDLLPWGFWIPRERSQGNLKEILILKFTILNGIFDYIPIVRHRLRPYYFEEICWCCRTVGWQLGRWSDIFSRETFRLFWLPRQHLRKGQLGWWWRIHLPQWCPLRPPCPRNQCRRWVARHRPRNGLARIHSDPAHRDLFVPRLILPHVGTLLSEQMLAKICLPANAFLWSMWSPEGNLHWHLQVAIGLFVSHFSLNSYSTLQHPPTKFLQWILHERILFK